MLNTPSTTSPYVTDHQPPPRESPGGKADARGQTLEEMYSAPENTLEIEVREPRTQGESASLGSVWGWLRVANSGRSRDRAEEAEMSRRNAGELVRAGVGRWQSTACSAVEQWLPCLSSTW